MRARVAWLLVIVMFSVASWSFPIVSTLVLLWPLVNEFRKKK